MLCDFKTLIDIGSCIPSSISICTSVRIFVVTIRINFLALNRCIEVSTVIGHQLSRRFITFHCTVSDVFEGFPMYL